MRSTRSVMVGLCLSVLGVGTESLTAQEVETDRDDAWRQYEAEKKSELAAAGLEFLVPVVGHAYAGDAGRGVKPLAVSLGGLVILIVGTTVGCTDRFLGECINSGSSAMIAIGLVAYLGGRIWGIVSALETAQQYNTALKERLNLSLSLRPAPQGLGVGLSYAIP